MKEILEILVNFNCSISEAQILASKLRWYDEELIKLKYEQLIYNLVQINLDEAIKWCEIFECREDIEMDDNVIEVVTFIANHSINGLKNDNDYKKYINSLK